MMTSPRTRLLSLLATFLLLTIVPTVAELVDSISDCDHFLLGKTPPQVPGVLEGGNILDQNRFKTICQTYRNQRRFVTLYDIKNKIPVFSAYKYRGNGGARRPQNWWKIEPQLEGEDDKNMMLGEKNKTYNQQAGDADYRGNGAFDRGHLYPSSCGFNKTDKISTFTLTNIVPQADSFNRGSWNRMEKCIKCVMDKFCLNNNGVIEGFVVTGAEPSANNMLRNRVNIPSKLWSAFCCYSSGMNSWIASAHWGENVRDESKNKHLQTRTLEKLHEELRSEDSEFKVFPGSKCPQFTTVTQFYPELNATCECPPSFPSTSAPPTATSGHPTFTSAPITSTSGHPTSTSAPITSTSGHPTSTSAPPTATSGHPTSTSDPFTSTSAHPTSTSDPLTSSSGPQTTTSSSNRPASTSIPSTTTPGSLMSTSGPPTTTSTSAPSNSTSGPHSTTLTSVPPTVSSYHPNTSFGQLMSTSGPVASTSVAPSSTSGPPTTPSTSDPITSTSGQLTSPPFTQ